jgi:hypothetical protein
MEEDNPNDNSGLDRDGKRSKRDVYDSQNGNDTSLGKDGAVHGGVNAALAMPLEHGEAWSEDWSCGGTPYHTWASCGWLRATML